MFFTITQMVGLLLDFLAGFDETMKPKGTLEPGRCHGF